MANLLSTSVSGSLSSTGRISTTYNTDRYQFNLNRESGSNWWFANDTGSLGLHLNGVGDKFYFSTGGDFWSESNGWLSTALAAKQNSSTAITTSNIGSQSVSYATSAGDAATVGGKTATNNANNLAVYESNGYLYIPSWMNVNGGGIFSSTNNAHLRPNTSSYGAWEMIGSRNGWSGIFFNDSNNTLMANADESGFYKIGDGWQFRWYRGEMYISPGTYGGGAERTVIHSGNIGSQSVSYASSAGNADTLDGYHSNTVGNRHHTARGFTVGGDQNTYYPVTFGGSGAYAFNRYSIYRYYQWTAPWDPLGTGYHRGGLTFDFEWSGDTAWGGNDHTLRVIQLSEQYTSQVGGLALPVTQGVCVWLRGGTSYYEIQVDAYPVDVVVHLEGFTAGNGVFYGPREDNSNIQSEIYNRMPVRGSSELYDGGSRVITAGNIASQSVSYAVTSGTSSATTQTNFSELFIADAPVATKEYVTSQGYITGYTETDTLQSVTDRGASTSAQVSFTKTDDHAISVGTIRGRAVGSQGGEFIQLYERVNIGGPSGWGAANTSAPTYGLSVFGGASIGYGNSGGLTVTGQSNLNGQVYINRHIDANTGWGNASGNTIFVGWNGGKVVLGNSNSGGHDYARDITEQSIVSTNQHYFYTTANFNSNVNINGGIKQNNIVGRPYAVWGASGGSTGAVVIKFPGNADNYGMVHAVVDIYEYNGNNVCTIVIGGHNWGNRWYSYGANMVGFTDKPVRLAFKDGQYAIVIGNDSSSWSYGQVVLRKIQNGSYYAGVMDVASGYTVGIEPESSTWISEDLRGLRVGGPVSATNISTGVTANHIVQRDANGYIYANHINFSTPESENPTINSFITSNGDGWSRKSSLAHVRNQLGNYGSWITTDGRAYPRRADGSDMNFYWDGQGGQPTWLWGSSDGQNMYVWNPSNFSVNYATTSGTSSATTQTNFAELFIDNVAVATKEYVTSQGYLTSLPSHNHDGSYLPIAGKAADSELLDGLDSSRFLYTTSGAFSGDWNTLTDSDLEIRLVEVHNITGGAHSNHPTGLYTYGSVLGWQLSNSTFKLYNSHTGDLAFQTGWNNDGHSGWRTIIHSANIGSQSVSYASSAGSADILDGYHESSFWRDGQNRPIGVLRFTGEGGDSGNGSLATSYGIYQQGGAWTHPYPDLCIGFHTGIKIGAHHSYGGTRFYNNSDWVTEIFSVGNGDNHVRVENNLYVGNTIYNNGNAVIHAGNIGSQSVSYATTSGTSSATTQTNFSELSIEESPVATKEYVTSQGYLTSLPSHNHDDRYLVKGGSWYGSGLPGSRWGGFSVSGGEIVFGDGLPNAGQMGVLIDGAYLAGENNGFWSLPSDNSWGGRRGMYWDGTYLNFTVNSAVALFSDVRAPIFYDSNDTGYYLDPNGTSNLLQLTTATRARWNMPRVWYDRSSRSSDQGYWTGTNGWGTSDGTWATAWKGGFSGWDIWGTGTDHPQGGGYIHAQGIVSGLHAASSDGSSAYGWMMVGAADATANRYWLRGKWDTTTSAWVEMITTGNIGSQSVSYADTAGSAPANGGNAATANRANGNFYIDNNYGNTVVGVYESHRYQGVWAMGDAYKLPADGTSTGGLYGLAWSHPNAGGVAGNLNTHGLLVINNGAFAAAISSSIRAATDMRAPIFYDSEDTGYYVDPNGQSHLNKLTLAGSTHFYPNSWIEFSGHYGLYSGHNSAHFYPNNASYGSWRVAGSRNGWHGIHFDSGATLMMNSNESGVHREGYGWQWRWENGTMYCHKNSYGGGTQATVLDSSNWSNFISVPQGLVTGNTSSAEINTSKFNIYNNNLTEQAVVLQMNTTDILVYDRMQGLSRLRGGIEGVVELMIDQSGFYFWTTEQMWQPIFCEYVDQVSDIKLKHHIRTIPSALDKVKQLRGVEFLWKKNNQPSIGFIAQEVEEVLPVAVGNANDTKTIDYSKIIPVLTEAIKEQQTLIEQLMARLEALETR